MKKTNQLFADNSEYCYSLDDDVTTQMAKFAVERHKIYLKRSLGRPRPWTKDPVLRSQRFCNVYRELDTVSIWIRQNIIDKYERNENLWFMLAIARLINWPPTLQHIMDAGLWPTKQWKPMEVYELLKDWYESGNKVITSAYLVNSVKPKGMKVPDERKVYYIPVIGLDPMWQDRKKIGQNFNSTLELAANTIKSYHGWADFMSYQVVVDLTYTKKWLKRAPDYNTFNLPGPGTKRGLNRYFTGSRDITIPKKDYNRLLIQQRDEVNSRVKELVPKKYWTGNFETGFAEISLSNQSNLNCEWDKIQRVRLGEGEMRAKYSGN